VVRGGQRHDRYAARAHGDRRRLLTLEPLLLRAGSSRAEARGTFGLAAGRSGALAYEPGGDSLHELARSVVAEADTIVVPAGAASVTIETLHARRETAGDC